MQNASHLLQSTQQFATGGWGPNETFIEPHKGQLYESLHTTNDHFETPCGSYAAIKLARYLLCATGDARYGDGLERVVFNGILAVKEPDADGDYPYYSTYGAAAHKVFYPKKWPCCSGTLVEGVADYVKNIYFRAHDGVAVNLYAPSRVQWTERGSRGYARAGDGLPAWRDGCFARDLRPRRLNSRCACEFPHGKTQAPQLRVNGKPVHADLQQGFAVVRRRWTSGDALTIEFPLQFRTRSHRRSAS